MNPREEAQVHAANAVGTQPIVLIHGLWLLAESWRPWQDRLEEHGYPTVAVDWPGDPVSVAEAREHPEMFAGTSVGAAVKHIAEVISALSRPPALVGHSFGGQVAEILAGRGLAAATVSIDRAPGRGILPMPLSTLRSSFPVLGNPRNRAGVVTLTYEQFRYAFANAVGDDEARSLYAEHHVAAPGLPFFQAAVANLNPSSETAVDVANPDRGPMLFVSGGRDHTAPPAIAKAAYRRQRKNRAATEVIEFADRGHSLTFDAGWRAVADAALTFLASHGIGPRGPER